ncbi:hypothetical protein NPIL_194711 [Nephila pilipes]|uniref:Uncharacterized protein n=1 Tax=Nephila pilipes TaxID=299642 RepID=A0A8X6PJ75_NEPPI|nr:hypothetical protein NPIL_194711 [Nephila pilipes]
MYGSALSKTTSLEFDCSPFSSAEWQRTLDLLASSPVVTYCRSMACCLDFTPIESFGGIMSREDQRNNQQYSSVDALTILVHCLHCDTKGYS